MQYIDDFLKNALNPLISTIGLVIKDIKQQNEFFNQILNALNQKSIDGHQVEHYMKSITTIGKTKFPIIK